LAGGGYGKKKRGNEAAEEAAKHGLYVIVWREKVNTLATGGEGSTRSVRCRMIAFMGFHRLFVALIWMGMISPGVVLAEDDAHAAIRYVLEEQAAAWNRGDIDGFMAAYARSSETTFVSGDEVTRGWQTVRDRYAKKYDSREKMGQLVFSDLTVTPLCADIAIVLGSWRLERADDQPHGKFTLLFRRLPDGWRIVMDHTS
jgi:ketosteroid isomerase-like protein